MIPTAFIGIKISQHLSDILKGTIDLFCSCAVPLLLFVLYFLPAIAAKGTPRFAAIFIANLVFGWTILGWIIILIWALGESGTAKSKATRP